MKNPIKRFLYWLGWTRKRADPVVALTILDIETGQMLRHQFFHSAGMAKSATLKDLVQARKDKQVIIALINDGDTLIYQTSESYEWETLNWIEYRDYFRF